MILPAGCGVANAPKRAASFGDIAAACVATAPPPSRGLESLRSQQESSTVIYSDHERTPKGKTATPYPQTPKPGQGGAVEPGPRRRTGRAAAARHCRSGVRK